MIKYTIVGLRFSWNQPQELVYLQVMYFHKVNLSDPSNKLKHSDTEVLPVWKASYLYCSNKWDQHVVHIAVQCSIIQDQIQVTLWRLRSVPQN